MKKVHESFTPYLMDTLPRLICPTCLSRVKRKEGSYKMDSHLALCSDLRIATCSTIQHELPKSFIDALPGSKGGEAQSVNMNEGSGEMVLLIIMTFPMILSSSDNE